MMGFSAPGDQKVPISVRDWNALRLALWRSRVGWEIAAREAADIVDRCAHTEGCPGRDDETMPCPSNRYENHVIVQEGCPDREQRMSALVVLNAARMFAPIDARKAASDPYMAPSREYFSEVIADLAAAQAELDVLRAALSAAGIAAPPSPNPSPELPVRVSPHLAVAQYERTLEENRIAEQAEQAEQPQETAQ
jgi:hypothetical protein